MYEIFGQAPDPEPVAQDIIGLIALNRGNEALLVSTSL